MNLKKLGIVLFLLIAVICFSCSSVSAGDFPNDLHMDVSIGGGTGNCLKVYSYLRDADAEYDHVTGKIERRLTWLAMNNNINRILVASFYENKWIQWRLSEITSDKWGNNVDNIDYLWVESKYDDYPRTKLYLKNGTIIDTDEWRHI